MAPHPTLTQALNELRLGRKAQAQALLARLVQQEPDFVDAWVALAACLDEPERQRYCLERALALRPEHPQARQALAALEGASFAAQAAPAAPETPPAEEVVVESFRQDWLTEAPAVEPPAPESEAADSFRLDWLAEEPAAEAPAPEGEAADSFQLDWLAEQPAAEAPAPEGEAADSFRLDWLAEEPAAEAPAPEAPAPEGEAADSFRLDWLAEAPAAEAPAPEGEAADSFRLDWLAEEPAAEAPAPESEAADSFRLDWLAEAPAAETGAGEPAAEQAPAVGQFEAGWPAEAGPAAEPASAETPPERTTIRLGADEFDAAQFQAEWLAETAAAEPPQAAADRTTTPLEADAFAAGQWQETAPAEIPADGADKVAEWLKELPPVPGISPAAPALAAPGAAAAAAGAAQARPGRKERKTDRPEAGAPGPTIPWYEAWGMALFSPSDRTYQRLLQDPKASPGRGYGWVYLTSLVSIILNVLIWVLFQPPYLAGLQSQLPPELGLDFQALFGKILIGMLIGSPVLALFSILGVMLTAALYQLIARLLIGEGTYRELVYVLSAIIAPFSLITVLFNLPVPGLSWLGSVASLYSLFLTLLAVKAVNRFGWGSSCITVAAIPILMILCSCVLGAVFASQSASILPGLLGTTIPPVP